MVMAAVYVFVEIEDESFQANAERNNRYSGQSDKTTVALA